MAETKSFVETPQGEHIWNLNKAIRVCGDMQKAVLSTDNKDVREYAAATLLRCYEMCAGLAIEFNLPEPNITSGQVEELRELAERVNWA